MAVKTVIVSDISGSDIPDEQHARIVIDQHPSVNGAVELDVSTDEAQKVQAGKIELVEMTVYEPNAAPRRVVMDSKAFNAAFKGIDMETVLAGARRAEQPSQSAPARRGRPPGSGTRSAAPKGDKVNYQSMENAGRPHRGRVTDAEKEIVRSNLDAINKRLESEGLATIDPSDPKAKEKWGF